MSAVANDIDNSRIEINIENSEINDEKAESHNGLQLGKLKLFLLMLGLSFGVFFTALDQTIVSTAVASEFNALDKIALFTTAYLLTSIAFQPIYGKFSDIFGRKETFLFAIFIFEIGSSLCGIASNMTTMIISRAVTGIGGGGIISLVMIMISDIVPPEDNGKYQGIIGAMFSTAPVVSPLISGAFMDHVNWRWSFYINLPFVAITIGIVVFLLRMPRPKSSLLQKLKRVDYVGIIVVIIATLALLLSLILGGNEYEWNSPIIIILLAIGVFGYLLFALIETKFATEPIAPPHLFKNMNIIGGYAANFFQGMVFFGLTYYLPLFFQVVKGDSVSKSTLQLFPSYVLGIVQASIGVGILVTRTGKFGYRTICAIGAVHIIVGVALLTLLNENTGSIMQMSFLINAGIGLGCITVMALLCAQNIVERKDFAASTTLLMFFRSIGGVLGIAIISMVFTNQLTNNLEKASIAPEYIEAVKQSATMVYRLPEEIRSQIITAYVHSLRSVFIAMIPMSVLCFISTLLMGNSKPKIRK